MLSGGQWPKQSVTAAVVACCCLLVAGLRSAMVETESGCFGCYLSHAQHVQARDFGSGRDTISVLVVDGLLVAVAGALFRCCDCCCCCCCFLFFSCSCSC